MISIFGATFIIISVFTALSASGINVDILPPFIDDSMMTEVAKEMVEQALDDSGNLESDPSRNPRKRK